MISHPGTLHLVFFFLTLNSFYFLASVTPGTCIRTIAIFKFYLLSNLEGWTWRSGRDSPLVAWSKGKTVEEFPFPDPPCVGAFALGTPFICCLF
jgi:hypothetical protein